jgi:uncharacterized protein (DUF697 family)/tellurite resistance protein
MNEQERRAILAISLMAAFADGDKHDREREEIRRIAQSLSDPQLNLAALYQEVLLGRIGPEAAAADLGSPGLRQYAYEMAVGVCDADGALSAPEKAFLERLRGILGLERAAAEDFAAKADAVALQPLAQPSAIEPAAPARVDEAALDRMILNYAILNGALELLPQNLASVAIIPLQMKMVYRVGKAHGFELDRGHIKDFLGTLGVGLTSQYLEQFGRKLLGGLLGQIGGGLGRTIGSAATGSAFSFATTYALGHVAKRYYADGRTLSTAALKQAFAGMLEQGQGLRERYLPDIQAKARTLDVGQVLAAARQ